MNFIKDVFRAILHYPKAVQLIIKLRLYPYLFIPLIISIVLMISFGLIVYFSHTPLAQFLGNHIPEFLQEYITVKVVDVMISVFLIGFFFLIFKHLVMGLSAPFMSKVSELIEEHFTQLPVKSPKFSPALKRGLRINLRNTLLELTWVIGLALLSWIPVVGIAFVILSFLIQAYYTGFGNIDYTLERYLNYKVSIRFVQRNKGLAVGNGIIFMLFAFIPILGIIFILPVSAVAATIATLERLKAEKFAPSFLS